MSVVESRTGAHGAQADFPPEASGDLGEGLVIVGEQLAEFGGVERILLTLMARYPRSRVVAGRFDARGGLPGDDFERRAAAMDVALETAAGEPRITLLGPGGSRSNFHTPLYARRLRALPLEGATTVLSLGGNGWTLAARAPSGSHHAAYVGGPPRAFYGHTDRYLRDYPRAQRLLLRARVPLLRAHHRRLLDRPARIVANARGCARALTELAGREVGVIYPPVRTRFFTPAARPRRHFLAVTRLFDHKRMDVVVEAFRRLPGERLVVAGAGPALAKLRRAAPRNVVFIGSVSDAELLELYRASIALVTASIEEFGISTAEALAAGIPVVGPRAGGTGEIVVDGRTGVLFDRVAPETVAEAVRESARREFDPDSCRRVAERFSEQRFLAELEELLSPGS